MAVFRVPTEAASDLSKASGDQQRRTRGWPIVLKNSVFGKIDEVFVRARQPTFRSKGFGQIGLMSLM